VSGVWQLLRFAFYCLALNMFLIVSVSVAVVLLRCQAMIDSHLLKVALPPSPPKTQIGYESGHV